MFAVPEYIQARPDGLTKFNLILLAAVGQGILRPEETAQYRRIWDRGRKTHYWARHIKDLVELLEERASHDWCVAGHEQEAHGLSEAEAA